MSDIDILVLIALVIGFGFGVCVGAIFFKAEPVNRWGDD